jgi:hypothetical protein
MNLINGDVKITRRRGEARRVIESLPDFNFVRSRIKAIRQARHFLAGRHEIFGGLPSFNALVESIKLFDESLLACEQTLVNYALGELDENELAEELSEFSEQLALDAEDLSPHGLSEKNLATRDVAALVERFWSEIWELVYRLQDALKSVSDDDKIGVPKWLLEFEKHEGRRFKSGGRSTDEIVAEILAKPIDLPRAYTGDFEVENDDFVLVAKHFVVREDGISFDFEGDGDEGHFRLEGSSARKDDGQFEVNRFDYSGSQFQSILEATIELKVVKPVFGACKVVGEWRQDGEVWQFSGELSPYRPPSSGGTDTISLG